MLVGGELHGVLGIAACLAGVGVHPVPVEIGQQLRDPLFVLFVRELGLQEFLILHEHVLGQILLIVHAVFDAVEALLRGQVKQIVDADAEDLRQKGKGGDVRHGHPIFPLGHRLGADPQLFRQLLLGQSRLEAELPDFLSQFHPDNLLNEYCFLIASSLYETGPQDSITQISSVVYLWQIHG